MNETQLVRVIQQTVQPMLDQLVEKTIKPMLADLVDKKMFDQALAEQDKRFDDKLNTGLAKMFAYMERRFDEMDRKKADKADVERILAILDKDAKQREIDSQERLMILRQLERHDRWIHRLARTTNTKLAA